MNRYTYITEYMDISKVSYRLMLYNVFYKYKHIHHTNTSNTTTNNNNTNNTNHNNNSTTLYTPVYNYSWVLTDFLPETLKLTSQSIVYEKCPRYQEAAGEPKPDNFSPSDMTQTDSPSMLFLSNVLSILSSSSALVTTDNDKLTTSGTSGSSSSTAVSTINPLASISALFAQLTSSGGGGVAGSSSSSSSTLTSTSIPGPRNSALNVVEVSKCVLYAWVYMSIS